MITNQGREALKPCPFCGSDEVSKSEGSHADGSPWFYIECHTCAACAEPDIWNTRAQPAAEPLPNPEVVAPFRATGLTGNEAVAAAKFLAHQPAGTRR
jgi:hypothetical protein